MKHLFIVSSLFALFQSTFAITWTELLETKKELLARYNCQLIAKQLKEFQNNNSPAISDIRIKAIAIEECNEFVIDIRKAGHPRIVMLPNPPTPFASPDCNSGFTCASKIRFAVFDKLVTMVNYLNRLAPEFGYQPGQISIAVFEGLRDISTQEQLFVNKRKEIQAAHPLFTDEELDKETSKWVSPVKNNVPVHSTGAAIDIQLLCNGQLMDFGKFGVIWGANSNAPTFSESCTDTQKLNRLFLLVAATMAGLTNYSYEFWHFSYGDRYDAYWKESATKLARYGSVK